MSAIKFSCLQSSLALQLDYSARSRLWFTLAIIEDFALGVQRIFQLICRVICVIYKEKWL